MEHTNQYSIEITQQVITKHKESLDEVLGDITCDIVDQALSGIYLHLSTTEKGVSVDIGHNVEDSETYGNPFLVVDLESHIIGDGYDQNKVLALANAFERLAKELRSYTWED